MTRIVINCLNSLVCLRAIRATLPDREGLTSPTNTASASVASKRGGKVFFHRDGWDKVCKFAIDMMQEQEETGIVQTCNIRDRYCDRIDKGRHDCCAYDEVK